MNACAFPSIGRPQGIRRFLSCLPKTPHITLVARGTERAVARPQRQIFPEDSTASAPLIGSGM